MRALGVVAGLCVETRSLDDVGQRVHGWILRGRRVGGEEGRGMRRAKGGWEGWLRAGASRFEAQALAAAGEVEAERARS